MRFPRVRFTVRAMMIAVAIVAVFSGAEALRRRAHDLLREVEKCNAQAQDYRAKEAQQIRLFARLAKDEFVRDREKYSHVAAFWERRARAYRYGAAHPWLTVKAEPFPP